MDKGEQRCQAGKHRGHLSSLEHEGLGSPSLIIFNEKGRDSKSQGLPKISFGKMSWSAGDSTLFCSKRSFLAIKVDLCCPVAQR